MARRGAREWAPTMMVVVVWMLVLVSVMVTDSSTSSSHCPTSCSRCACSCSWSTFACSHTEPTVSVVHWWWCCLVVVGVRIKKILGDRIVSPSAMQSAMSISSSSSATTYTNAITVSRRTATVIDPSNSCDSDSNSRHDRMVHHIHRQRRKRHRVCKQVRRRRSYSCPIIPIGILRIEQHLITQCGLSSSSLNLL